VTFAVILDREDRKAAIPELHCPVVFVLLHAHKEQSGHRWSHFSQELP